jgi:hypothetical protein
MAGSATEVDAVELRYQSDSASVIAGPAWYLQVFHKVPTVADLDAIEDNCRKLPHPYCVFTVVENTRSVAITGEARQRTDALAKTTADWVAVNALVVKGEGFVGAMTRGIIAAVTFAMNDHPYKVVGKVSEAIAFAVPHLGKLAIPTTAARFEAGIAAALKLAGHEGLE